MLMPGKKTTANYGVDNLLELNDVYYSKLQEALNLGIEKEGFWVLAFDQTNEKNFEFINIKEYIDNAIKEKLKSL